MPTRNEIANQVIQAKEKAQDEIRRTFFREFHECTSRDAILYASAFSSRKGIEMPGLFLSIVLEDMQGFMSALHGLEGKELDLILHSPGGSLEAAEQIVTYLRSKYDHIRAIVPQNAMSAATMIACACDEIIMGKHSALGPIDPQITVPTQAGPFTAPAQAILDEFERAKQEVVEDPRTAPLWVTRIQAYPQGVLAMCQEAIELSKERVEEWLNTYMFRNQEKQGGNIAGWLSDAKLHKSHGRPIGIEQAQEHGLKITALEDDQELQERVLSLFHATTITFDATNCIKLIENHLGKGSYVNVNVQVTLAPGLPVAAAPPDKG